MAIIDLVKWKNESPNFIAWKFPSDELSTWTQLIVNEYQEAFVVRGGVYDGPFGGGRHTLTTENIPLIRGILGLPFGGESPFSAEVWFVNKLTNLNIKWGTPDPIQLEDPKYKIMMPVRAFGQYGVKVKDSKKFLLKLVGTLSSFDVETLGDYFNGVLMTKIKTEISTSILKLGVSVLDITPQLENLSDLIKKSLTKEIEDYGIEIAQFNIHSINVPETDPAIISLKAALAKRAEMGIVGFNYQQERSFDVLETAAGNEGSSGNVMGAGLGLGIGAGIGGAMGQFMGTVTSPNGEALLNSSTSKPKDPNAEAFNKVQLLKELSELKSQGILTEEEFLLEKQKILAK